MQDSGSLAVFKVTARDQGHYKGPSGAFVTYCNISCLCHGQGTDRTGELSYLVTGLVIIMSWVSQHSFIMNKGTQFNGFIVSATYQL